MRRALAFATLLVLPLAAGCLGIGSPKCEVESAVGHGVTVVTVCDAVLRIGNGALTVAEAGEDGLTWGDLRLRVQAPSLRAGFGGERADLPPGEAWDPSTLRDGPLATGETLAFCDASGGARTPDLDLWQDRRDAQKVRVSLGQPPAC